MKVSYKKLWKLLIDKNIKASELQSLADISSGSMTKIRKGEAVSMSILWKICCVLQCDVGDIMSFEIPQSQAN